MLIPCSKLLMILLMQVYAMRNITLKIRHPRKRPFHKRVALHPVNILLFLCVGVVLTISTLQANAETIEVTATVPAPLPTAPAIITSPKDQDRLTTSSIQVLGTCPADSAYVTLHRNGVFSGVGQCESGGFQIQTTLTIGANELWARVYNFTNNEGPVSAPITVYYDPPTPTPPIPEPPLPEAPFPVSPRPPAAPVGREPLVVTTEYKYQTHFTGGTFEWRLQL